MSIQEEQLRNKQNTVDKVVDTCKTAIIRWLGHVDCTNDSCFPKSESPKKRRAHNMTNSIKMKFKISEDYGVDVDC